MERSLHVVLEERIESKVLINKINGAIHSSVYFDIFTFNYSE